MIAIKVRNVRRRNKYGAKKTIVDGIAFASKREAAEYMGLKMQQAAGVIYDLLVHPVFPLVVNGTKIGRYTADFRYKSDGDEVVVEVKGFVTRDYSLRKRLFKALYPELVFLEVR